MARPSSIRMTPAVSAALDAWATWIATHRDDAPSRARALEYLITHCPPPGELSPQARSLREAIKALKEGPR